MSGKATATPSFPTAGPTPSAGPCVPGTSEGCPAGNVCVAHRDVGQCSVVFDDGRALWQRLDEVRGRYVLVRRVTLEAGPSQCTLMACKGPKGLDGCCNSCVTHAKPKNTPFHSMSTKTGPAYSCPHGACERASCFDEAQAYELIGRVKGEAPHVPVLVEVELRPVTE
jgi:hypothetical protein